MKQLNERLNEIIEEKEDIIEELKEKIEQMESNSDLRKLSYQLHQHFVETELQKSLPFPRLEMRFNKIGKDWYDVEWHYGIVYKHYYDTGTEIMLFIPISRTTSSGGGLKFEDHYHNGKIELPFRDKMHIFSESKIFNMPAFIICEEKNIVQEINLDVDISRQLKQMKREAIK